MKGQKGFTYIEIIIAIVILGIVSIPISMGFVTATRNRIQAQRVYEATHYGENLLKEIEERIDKGALENVTPSPLAKLDTLLLDPSSPASDIGKLYTRLKSEEYSYEIAIWKVDDNFIGKDNIVANPHDSNDGAKIYAQDLIADTDLSVEKLNKAPTYKLNTDDNYKLDSADDKDNIQWSISKKMVRALVDMPYKGKFSTYKQGEVRPSCGRKVLTLNRIDDTTLNIAFEDGTTEVESYKPEELTGKKELANLDYSNGTCTIRPATNGIVGDINLVVDATKLDLSPTNVFYRLRFINDCSNSVTVKVVTKPLSTSNKEKLMGAYREFDKKLKVSVAKKDTTKGNIVKEEYTDTLRNTTPYLIAMVIRDKHPRAAKQGDVIKKMTTIYVSD